MEATELICGGCLCGSIAFELLPSSQFGPDGAMGICHCTNCQRWSGGANLPFVVVVPERFRLTKGQELAVHYRDDASTLRAFCRRCGSALYQDNGTTFHVSAGALRDLTLRPTFHLHTDDAAPWADPIH